MGKSGQIFRTTKDKRSILKNIMILCFAIIAYSQIQAQQKESEMIPDHFSILASNFPDYCVIHGSPDSKSIALTFDDGPSEVTEQVLDILEKYNSKATFFWQGQNLWKHQGLVKRAISSGHEFGNHSWSHLNGLPMETEKLWEEQVSPTTLVFDSLFGLDVNLYRPPFGAISADQVEFIGNKGMKVVLWSLSTFDWDIDRNSGSEIAERFKKNLHQGAIVLLHDVDFDHTSPEMLTGLEGIINFGQKHGYDFVTISEAIKRNQ
ncbi:MAG: peptidoglycan/xylan/chitin deacetylase (PgdA/CDA1 family) [Cyclobacteriaceae bacterium]|jgi:peptidoglycan/xylan/chitin deacetylase (PgdA/CDA1 family)